VAREWWSFHVQVLNNQVEYGVHEVVCAHPLPHEVSFDELSSSCHGGRIVVTTRVEELRKLDI
jgi:hypothetical protein